MIVRFHPAARADLNEAAEHLDGRTPGLGLELVEDAERAVSLAVEFPQLGRPIDARHRAIPFPRFSYVLVYRVEASVVNVIAIAHKRRRPGYWRRRQ